MKVIQHFINGLLDGRTIRGLSDRKRQPKRIAFPFWGPGQWQANYEKVRQSSEKGNTVHVYYHHVENHYVPPLTLKEIRDIYKDLAGRKAVRDPGGRPFAGPSHGSRKGVIR